MTNQKLKKYIKKQLEKGISKEKIREALLKKGWKEKTVKDTFKKIEKKEVSSLEPSKKRKARGDIKRNKIKKNRKSWIKEIGIKKIIGSISLLLIILGIIILVIWSPFKKDPQENVDKAVAKTINVKSFQYKMNTSLGGSEGSLSFEINEKRQLVDEIKFEGEAEITVKLEGSKISEIANYITTREGSFLKFTPFSDLDEEEKKWVQVSTSKDLENKKNHFKKIFIVKKELKDEVIQDKKTHHYLVELDRDKLEEILYFFLKSEVSDTLSKEEIKNEVSKAIDEIAPLEAEIWVGKRNNYIRKIKINKEVEENSTLGANFELYNFNKEFDITAPEEYIPPEEQIGGEKTSVKKMIIEAFSTYIGIIKARKKTRDSRRRNNIKEISFEMETNYNEGDHYLTSEEMPNKIGDDMKEAPSDPKTEKPYNWIDNTNNNQKYCVYAELEAEDKYFVASHKGTKKIKEEPTSLECGN